MTAIPLDSASVPPLLTLALRRYSAKHLARWSGLSVRAAETMRECVGLEPLKPMKRKS